MKAMLAIYGKMYRKVRLYITDLYTTYKANQANFIRLARGSAL